MFYLKLILGLVLKNPVKTAFAVILIWLWTIQSRHSVPVTYRSDIGFSQEIVRKGNDKIVINRVKGDCDIEYDTSFVPKFLVAKDGKLPLIHDERGWYYTTRSKDHVFTLSWIGIVLFSIVLFFCTVNGDDDFNWEYGEVWVETAKRLVGCHEEDGHYHYVFGKYLIYQTPVRGYNSHPDYYLDQSLRLFRKHSKSFPIWEPIEVRRDRKLGKLV